MGSNYVFETILALTIYGILLFPSFKYFVDMDAIRVFMTYEEEKVAEHGDDNNVGADVEDNVGGIDAENDEDKEAEGEECATINSNRQEDI
ncbi:hypothetical protein KIW84_034309 [Lathyrus oleraceus]|uniref:DUF7745 domain-containing protein n=1 Tax=Pisum sativum TaxID=3888 RepID=A0A9D5B116_PEA|nr:hypothetical protein KIW84_034309 [Pisum sativum]